MNLWVTAEDGAEVCEGGNLSQTCPPRPHRDGFSSRGLTKPDRALLQYKRVPQPASQRSTAYELQLLGQHAATLKSACLEPELHNSSKHCDRSLPPEPRAAPTAPTREGLCTAMRQ